MGEGREERNMLRGGRLDKGVKVREEGEQETREDRQGPGEEKGTQQKNVSKDMKQKDAQEDKSKRTRLHSH